jgi:hypothetical protein
MKMGLVVDDGLVLIQMLDERNDAAVVLKLVALSVPLIIDGDEDAAIQKGELAETLGERVEAVLGRLENLRVGFERDFCAASLRRSGDLEIGNGVPRS